MSKNVSSLSKSGDAFADQEDQIADQISSLKQRCTQGFIEGMNNTHLTPIDI